MLATVIVFLCHDINLDIERGSRVAIIGANGIGKSTLLKTLMRETAPLNGEFQWGERVALGYFAQDQNALLILKPVCLVC